MSFLFGGSVLAEDGEFVQDERSVDNCIAEADKGLEFTSLDRLGTIPFTAGRLCKTFGWMARVRG